MTTQPGRTLGQRRRRGARAGFTILEVMLASILGLMVILAAIGLFGSVRISNTQSEQAYASRMELALTQEAVERAMKRFIMSPASPAQPSAAAAAAAAAAARTANRTAGTDEGAAAPETQPPAGRPRVLLETDRRFGASMRWLGPDGRERLVTPQRLEVTLTKAPVFAVPTREDLMQQTLLAREDARALSERRSAHREGSQGRREPRSRGSRRESGASAAAGDMDGTSRARSGSSRGSDSEGASLADLVRRAGFDPGAVTGAPEGAAALLQSIAQEQEGDEETALAPGVRGVFEVQWDPHDAARARPGEPMSPDGGTWSLWWRTIDPDEVDARNEIARSGANLSAQEQLALLREQLGPEPRRSGMVRLASNLVSCRWECVRRGETLDDFTAYFEGDLPAYFTLELQTTAGQWMKWMFEVDWTRGDEPGTPIGGNDQGTAGGVPGLRDLPVIGNNFRGAGTRNENASNKSPAIETNSKGGNP
ncbi:MAG: PilW family protein [Phycisphaerales bacterium]